MNARQNIKLPAPADISVPEQARYDKASMFINENFKSLFDAVDEMGKTIKKLTARLDESGGGE